MRVLKIFKCKKVRGETNTAKNFWFFESFLHTLKNWFSRTCFTFFPKMMLFENVCLVGAEARRNKERERERLTRKVIIQFKPLHTIQCNFLIIVLIISFLLLLSTTPTPCALLLLLQQQQKGVLVYSFSHFIFSARFVSLALTPLSNSLILLLTSMQCINNNRANDREL